MFCYNCIASIYKEHLFCIFAHQEVLRITNFGNSDISNSDIENDVYNNDSVTLSCDQKQVFSDKFNMLFVAVNMHKKVIIDKVGYLWSFANAGVFTEYLAILTCLLSQAIKRLA